MICKKTKTSFVSKDTAKIYNSFTRFTIPALLAGLGAAGSLAGGAAAIASAVNKKKADDKLLSETKRHNEAMESKKGSGIRLTPRKKTCGKNLYLKPPKKYYLSNHYQNMIWNTT